MADEVRFPHSNVSAVTDLSKYIATNYGPMSMDKLVVTESESQAGADPRDVGINDYLISSDGAEILRNLPLQHPAGSLIRGVIGFRSPGDSDTEGEYIPDGITGSVILTAALLDEAIELIDDGIHPSDIRSGYHQALSKALETLDAKARHLPANGGTRIKRAIADTAMTGSDIDGQREVWCELAVEAIGHVGVPDQYTLPIRMFESGDIVDSELVRGTVLNRSDIAHDGMPRSTENASILILGGFERNTVSDERSGGLRDPTPVTDTSLTVDTVNDIEAINDLYKDRRDSIVDDLVRHDINVVVTELGITSEFLERLADNNIIAIRGVHSLKLRQLARATGAQIVKDVDDIRGAYLGTAGYVKEKKADQTADGRRRRRIVIFGDCPDPESVTMMIRGVLPTAQPEIARGIRKAAAAVAMVSGEDHNGGGYVPGGGGIDMRIASDVRAAATGFSDRTQITMQSFARATEEPVRYLVQNSGLDPLSMIPAMRRSANDDTAATGLILPDRKLGNVIDAGIINPAQLWKQNYTKSVELANMILNIDDAMDASLE